jgi:hypothetical protein
MTTTLHRPALVALVVTMTLAGCSRTPSDEPAATSDDTTESAAINVLMFGDSGYHLDYPDQDDYEDLFTAEEFYQSELDDWIEDKRPRDEFESRPTSISPVTGMVVPATGMHAISAAMKHYCANVRRCDFGLMLGDNIYPSGATLGADGFDDADRFRHMFTEPFGDLVSDPETYTTYVTLGNHDYETSREGGDAQIDFFQTTDDFYIEAPFYSVKPPGANGDVELFIIDTNMILATTTVYKDILNDDGSEQATDVLDPPDYFTEPMTEAEKSQPQWLEEALQASTAKWKLVVAHHPIWSSAGSKFQEAIALRKLILPAMCRYADAYIVGHEHTLEIHEDSCAVALGEATAEPLVEIVSGAAAKQRPINSAFIRHQNAKYPEHKAIAADGLLWGFAHMTLKGDKAEVTLLTVPDDGSSEISTMHVYEFNRRSHLPNE